MEQYVAIVGDNEGITVYTKLKEFDLKKSEEQLLD